MAARRAKLAFTPERVAAEGHPYSCALEDLSFEAKPSFSVGWRGEPDLLPQLKIFSKADSLPQLEIFSKSRAG